MVLKVLSQNIKNIGGDWHRQFQCHWLLVKPRHTQDSWNCIKLCQTQQPHKNVNIFSIFFFFWVWFLNLMEAVCIKLSKQKAGGYQETFSCARNIFIFFLSLINISLFTGTQSMTKQVPSKHDTTRTVISILPLATFHQ